LCQGLGWRFCKASNGHIGGAQNFHLMQVPVVLERSKFPIHVLGPERGGALPKDRQGGIIAFEWAAVISVRSPGKGIGVGRLKPNLRIRALFGSAEQTCNVIGEARTIVEFGSKSVGDRFDKRKCNVVPQPLVPSKGALGYRIILLSALFPPARPDTTIDGLSQIHNLVPSNRPMGSRVTLAAWAYQPQQGPSRFERHTHGVCKPEYI
jgi:hypothetical protein